MTKRILSLIILIISMLSCALSACGNNSNITESVSKKQPNYIRNREVEYDSENAQHKVFWGFSLEDNDDDYMIADAVMHIKIVNDNGEEIFIKDYEVDENYYSWWNNSSWDSDRLLGCIYISDDELEKGTVDTGDLTISADVEDGSFSEYNTKIYNLPLKDIEVIMPDLPYEVKELNYKGAIKRKGEVLEFDVFVDYLNDGVAHLKYAMKYKMTYNSEGANKSEDAHVPYKIKDSEGMVVASATALTDPLAEGETVMDTGYINGDFYLGETYTLEFLDYE